MEEEFKKILTEAVTRLSQQLRDIGTAEFVMMGFRKDNTEEGFLADALTCIAEEKIRLRVELKWNKKLLADLEMGPPPF